MFFSIFSISLIYNKILMNWLFSHKELRLQHFEQFSPVILRDLEYHGQTSVQVAYHVWLHRENKNFDIHKRVIFIVKSFPFSVEPNIFSRYYSELDWRHQTGIQERSVAVSLKIYQLSNIYLYHNISKLYQNYVKIYQFVPFQYSRSETLFP